MKSIHPRQDQSVLTTAEAAEFFCRSASWVRNQINTGRLHTLHPYGVRPYLVTEASASIFKARLDERATGTAKPRLHVIAGQSGKTRLGSAGLRTAAPNHHQWPRLVVNNTRS